MFLPMASSSITTSTKNFGFENGSGPRFGLGVRVTFAVELIGPTTKTKEKLIKRCPKILLREANSCKLSTYIP